MNPPPAASRIAWWSWRTLCRRNPIPRSHHEREERSLRMLFQSRSKSRSPARRAGPWATPLRMLPLAIGNDAGDRHRQGRAHWGDQTGQVLGRGGQQALGQEDLAREAVPQDPKDLVADVGLQAVDGQDDPARVVQQWLQPLGVGGRLGPQLVVAVQEVSDGARGDS